MARLILGAFLIAVLALAAMAVLGVVRGIAALPATRSVVKEDPMPDAIRNIAFTLLLVLMLGVATGWLGAV